MSTDDIGLALRAMGALISTKEINLLVGKYDSDKTGKIQFDDFVAMLGEVLNKPDDQAQIRNAFSSFDKADRGLLSIEEMKFVMTRIGDSLSPEEATNFFNILDSHGDGYVRMDELTELLMPQTNKQPYSKAVYSSSMVDQSPHMSYGDR
jgi:Ca2+-binding EF-hand superfamily protein